MINSITSALSGINNASARVEKAAQNIAEGGSQQEIIEDVVEIKQASLSYKASLSVLKVTDELSQELLRTFDETV